jgi:predicted alpha/beta-fold hydrolase
VGGHRQTLLGYWSRRRLTWPHASEDMIVEAHGGVRLLLRASWQPGPHEESPALVLVHGLGGSDVAKYCVATGELAWRRGWHVVRMNMRGAGDALSLSPVLYNAGLDDDVVAVVAAMARSVPRVALAGFSLGASLTLLAAGRQAGRLPHQLRGLVAVSAPLDLAACADALCRLDNRLYQACFMAELRRAYRERQLARPDLYAPGRERGTRSVRDYDERITAPYGGYRDANEYYARASAGPHLAGIARPTLIVAAADDPIIPVASVERWPLSPSVTREVLPTGGHVGFVAPTAASGRFWAGERALDFLDSVA